MAAGGKTGLTAVTTGLLFAASAFFIPVFKWIPNSAIAPILIIIGGLMLQNIRNIDMKDLGESFPALIMIVMIPFTYSIADGIAIGFILYPLVKISIGKAKEVSVPLYIIAFLFLVMLMAFYYVPKLTLLIVPTLTDSLSKMKGKHLYASPRILQINVIRFIILKVEPNLISASNDVPVSTQFQTAR